MTDWQQLTANSGKISDLVNDRARNAALTRKIAGIRFDWSKTHLDAATLNAVATSVAACDFDARRRALFAGEAVNSTEGRTVTHMAERGEGNADDIYASEKLHERMRALIEAIDMGAFGEIRHILHIGIGGSALGPKLLVDALGRDGVKYDVAVVSNVDGAALAEAVAGFDPARTLVSVASKTFTTAETILNARSALEWMEGADVEDPLVRFVALTANPEAAVAFGIDETRILPFAESVGGRYSLWSSIGFSAALALGWDAFQSLLEGAAEMDRHFLSTDGYENMPLLAAFTDILYARGKRAETRAVFAYDERLRLLPDYLQQLEMESNGKQADEPTAPITWGGVGTDAQHAVFQLLHQGTHLVPVEFLAARLPGHDFASAHHRMLLNNCFAQGAALMKGQASDDKARYYPGDRPSATILLDDVSPAALGALLAFYEHRTFTFACLAGINPFDQFGVELGKVLAKEIEEGTGGETDPSTAALLEAAFGDKH